MTTMGAWQKAERLGSGAVAEILSVKVTTTRQERQKDNQLEANFENLKAHSP